MLEKVDDFTPQLAKGAHSRLAPQERALFPPPGGPERLCTAWVSWVRQPATFLPNAKGSKG